MGMSSTRGERNARTQSSPVWCSYGFVKVFGGEYVESEPSIDVAPEDNQQMSLRQI
jgi:hypothetical protein